MMQICSEVEENERKGNKWDNTFNGEPWEGPKPEKKDVLNLSTHDVGNQRLYKQALRDNGYHCSIPKGEFPIYHMY